MKSIIRRSFPAILAAALAFTGCQEAFASSAAMEAAAPRDGRLALDKPIVSLITGLELQVTNPVPPAVSNYMSFPAQVLQWIGSEDTNSVTFSIDNGAIWTGASYVSGANVSSLFGVSYNVAGKFEARGIIYNQPGIAQGIVGLEGGAGWHLYGVHDVRLTAFLDGGYDFNVNHPYIAPGLDVKKALGLHSFVGLAAKIPIDLRGANHSSLIPEVEVIFGATF